MSPLAKWIFVPLPVAVVIGGTLALRSKPAPAPSGVLTPAQTAELRPAQIPEPPKVGVKPVNDASDLPPPPEEEPEVEDGNGS